MKTLLFLFCWLNYYYVKRCTFFLQKFIGITISLFYLLEYIFVFFFQKKYIYIVFLNLFKKKENLIKKKDFYRIILVKRNKIKKKKEYISFFFKLYYKRQMYLGLSIVYMQIFLRKIKENKNYIKFLLTYKLIKFLIYLKKKNINYSISFFFSNNYFLSVYIDNLIRSIYIFYLIIKCRGIYNIIKLKQKIYLLKKKISENKWKI